jgi:hypothetical protein
VLIGTLGYGMSGGMNFRTGVSDCVLGRQQHESGEAE